MARTGPGVSGPEALRRRAIRLEYFTVGWNIVEATIALAAGGLETLPCSYLSATLLAGLALNGWLGWWWADSGRQACHRHLHGPRGYQDPPRGGLRSLAKPQSKAEAGASRAGTSPFS